MHAIKSEIHKYAYIILHDISIFIHVYLKMLFMYLFKFMFFNSMQLPFAIISHYFYMLWVIISHSTALIVDNPKMHL